MTEQSSFFDFCKRGAEKGAQAAGFTCDPSPRSHVYRLVLLLAVAGWAFFWVKDWMVPESWDAAGWYRAAAAEELTDQHDTFGGNVSCSGCHREWMGEFNGGGHSALSCESCHGPFGAHANGLQRTAEAPVDSSRQACLRCHGTTPGRNTGFPRFNESFHRDSLRVPEDRSCMDCHAPHDPTYQTGWGF
ncbi:MAG: cytochrome c3 family protein [Pseudomonadota bacterium]|nr:cytochrome c3 family protein [Pseudomonadota bacterium]